MAEYWFYLPINPEPWAIGNVGTGRKGGKIWAYVSPNPQLQSYQSAVKEEMETILVDSIDIDFKADEYDLEFFFWRNLSGGANWADSTNLQKATEDALQGVLFDNDRRVRSVASTIVEQDTECEPNVVIRIGRWKGFNDKSIPDHIWNDIRASGHEVQDPIDYSEGVELF
jgi:Holliday junction resolvase RusA-like endonuclease